MSICLSHLESIYDITQDYYAPNGLDLSSTYLVGFVMFFLVQFSLRLKMDIFICANSTKYLAIAVLFIQEKPV